MLRKLFGVVGVSSFLIAASLSAAGAADMPVKAAPYAPPAPVYSWTGFYVGGFIGAGWGTDSASLNTVTAAGVTVPIGLPLAQVSNSGVLGGGQVGYNYQTGWVVLGVEGDIAGTGITDSAPCIVVFSCTAKDNWLATASGRIGGVVGDGRLLVFVKGGGAWLNQTSSFATSVTGLSTIFPGTSATNTNTGWLLGMGTEYAFTQHWSGTLEYDYMDFGTTNTNFSTTSVLLPGGSASVAQTNKLSTVKAGLNYKF
jgi:outer membrane immunogenic protein